uniref:Chitin-binding type-2 domain-containing protein n=1 Tax=Anopheles minimus TaxID=112268 RepID=A0A182WEM8_9DIPT
MIYLAIIGLLFVGGSYGEIIVDSRARMALQTRNARSDVMWCELFYEDDFPDNSECETGLDGQWHTFPACCNGAYNCLGGGVWDMVLCPAEYVYNSLAEECLPYTGSECPPRNPNPGDQTSTEVPPVTCGTLVNGRLSYLPDCAKYIQCSQGNASLLDCPTGLTLNDERPNGLYFNPDASRHIPRFNYLEHMVHTTT